MTALLEVMVEAKTRIARAYDFAADGEIDAALAALEALELDIEAALARVGPPRQTTEAERPAA